MENFEQSQKQRKISLLAEVPAIRESRNEMVTKRERLKDLIEQPLLSACEEMYGTNRGQSPQNDRGLIGDSPLKTTVKKPSSACLN